MPLTPWFGIERADESLSGGVNVDLASLPSLPGFLNGPWIQVSGGEVTAVMFVSIQCKKNTFLSTPHWPYESYHLGHHDVSYLNF